MKRKKNVWSICLNCVLFLLQIFLWFVENLFFFLVPFCSLFLFLNSRERKVFNHKLFMYIVQLKLKDTKCLKMSVWFNQCKKKQSVKWNIQCLKQENTQKRNTHTLFVDSKKIDLNWFSLTMVNMLDFRENTYTQNWYSVSKTT